MRIGPDVWYDIVIFRSAAMSVLLLIVVSQHLRNCPLV